MDRPAPHNVETVEKVTKVLQNDTDLFYHSWRAVALSLWTAPEESENVRFFLSFVCLSRVSLSVLSRTLCFDAVSFHSCIVVSWITNLHSVTLLSGKDFEHVLLYWLNLNGFNVVGYGKLCSCTTVFNFVSTPLGGAIT